MDAKRTGLVAAVVVVAVYGASVLWPAGQGSPEARTRAIEALGDLFTRPLDPRRVEGDCGAFAPGRPCVLRIAAGAAAERADLVLVAGLEVEVELVPADPETLGLTATLDAARGAKQTLTFPGAGAHLEAQCVGPAPTGAKTCALRLEPR